MRDELDLYLNTVEGMQVLRNNVKRDEGADTIAGVDWFKFNNVVTNKLYASGNHWIGIGSSAEHLKVCRRDGAMWYLYRQEGTLYGVYRFIKIRWEGFTQYSSTDNSRKLVYEFFLFDTHDMFLNLIQVPTDAGYLGSSSLTCGSTTIPLTIEAGIPKMISFYHLDNTGQTWEVKYEKLVIELPFLRRFLLRDTNNVYTMLEGELAAIEGAVIGPELFTEHGMEELPETSVLLSIPDLKVLCWQDSYGQPVMNADFTAVPFDQPVYTPVQYMEHPSIAGIEKVTVDASPGIFYAVSFDEGITWLAYVNGSWGILSEADSGMDKAVLEGIGVSSWGEVATTGSYMFRFILPEGGQLSNIVVDYLNKEA